MKNVFYKKFHFGVRDAIASVSIGFIGYLGLFVCVVVSTFIPFLPQERFGELIIRAGTGEEVDVSPSVWAMQLEAASWQFHVLHPALSGFISSWLVSRAYVIRSVHLVLATFLFALERYVFDGAFKCDDVKPWLGVVLFFLCAHGVVGCRAAKRRFLEPPAKPRDEGVKKSLSEAEAK